MLRVGAGHPASRMPLSSFTNDHSRRRCTARTPLIYNPSPERTLAVGSSFITHELPSCQLRPFPLRSELRTWTLTCRARRYELCRTEMLSTPRFAVRVRRSLPILDYTISLESLLFFLLCAAVIRCAVDCW